MLRACSTSAYIHNFSIQPGGGLYDSLYSLDVSGVWQEHQRVCVCVGGFTGKVGGLMHVQSTLGLVNGGLVGKQKQACF